MTHNQALLADRLAECPGHCLTVLNACDDRQATVHVLWSHCWRAEEWLRLNGFRMTDEGESKRTKSRGWYFVVEWQESDEERGRRVLWPGSTGG